MTQRLKLLVAALALAPGLALAQATSPATSAPLGGSPPATVAPAAPRPRTSAARLDLLDQRIKDLHSRLKIAPAQEPQWSAFTDVMRANATQMGELYQTGNPQDMTALAALQHYAKIAQAHSEEITRLVAPFQALYDVMAPAQRKVADDAFHSFGRNGRLRG